MGFSRRRLAPPGRAGGAGAGATGRDRPRNGPQNPGSSLRARAKCAGAGTAHEPAPPLSRGQALDLRARRLLHPVRHRDLVARAGHQMHEPRLHLRPRPTGAPIHSPRLVTAPVRIAVRHDPRATRHPTGRVALNRLPVVPQVLAEIGQRFAQPLPHAPHHRLEHPRAPFEFHQPAHRTARSSSGSEPNRAAAPTTTPPANPLDSSGSASSTSSRRRSSGSFSTSDQEKSTVFAVAIVCLLTGSRYGFCDESIVPYGDAYLHPIRLICNILCCRRGRSRRRRGVKSAQMPLEPTPKPCNDAISVG